MSYYDDNGDFQTIKYGKFLLSYIKERIISIYCMTQRGRQVYQDIKEVGYYHIISGFKKVYKKMNAAFFSFSISNETKKIWLEQLVLEVHIGCKKHL